MRLKLIFIFSLPRSGSTLLQKILQSSNEIDSISEPCILLPILYSLKKDGLISEYAHSIASMKIQKLINFLPDKEQDYYSAIRAFAESVYIKLCDTNARYFLDKTPNYYLIIPLIAKVFPDAKFVFLFRNPLDILSSYIYTFRSGTLHRLDHFDKDLYEGYQYISDGFTSLREQSISVRYEDLLDYPSTELKRIFNYLELDFDEKVLKTYSESKLRGNWGDPNVLNKQKYSMILHNNSGSFKKRLNNTVRKRFAIDYINSLDENSLQAIGYNKNRILEEINMLNVKSELAIKDRWYLFETWCARKIKQIINWKTFS